MDLLGRAVADDADLESETLDMAKRLEHGLFDLLEGTGLFGKTLLVEVIDQVFVDGVLQGVANGAQDRGKVGDGAGIAGLLALGPFGAEGVLVDAHALGNGRTRLPVGVEFGDQGFVEVEKHGFEHVFPPM